MVVCTLHDTVYCVVMYPSFDAVWPQWISEYSYNFITVYSYSYSWHECEFSLINNILYSDWRHLYYSIIWQLSWQAHIVCTSRSLPEHEPLFDNSSAATKDMITPAVFPAPTTRSSAIWPLSKLNVRLAQCLSKTLGLRQWRALDPTICSRCCHISVAPDCVSSTKKGLPCSPQTYCTIDSFKI